MSHLGESGLLICTGLTVSSGPLTIPTWSRHRLLLRLLLRLLRLLRLLLCHLLLLS
jgi:hypothetical protein